MRYKLTIEYDGTGYKGWQYQDGLPTVQGALETAVFQFCQERTEVYGAGRTDAGVHALAQVAHVDISKTTTPETIKMALNAHLRDTSVVVLSVEAASDDFHARFSATKRHYLYRILNRSAPPALDKNRVWWIPQKLNVPAMETSAQFLIGQHDFTSFRDSECQAKSPVKTLEKINFETHGEEIWMRCSAPSFLHHQVRNIIGTLVEIGQGKHPPDWIKKVLEAKNRTAAGPTAPAHGLYFTRIEY